MNRKATPLIICLLLLALCLPGIASAAPEQRIALVIGNSAYSSGPLKNPVNDAADMAATLQKLGFNVILKRNANLETMEEAVEDFGNLLKKGGVGLFYYAGHGVQVNGVNYLIPIGAKIRREADVKYHSVDANKILDEMAYANNGLNIVILDACRDNPYARSFRSATRGLAIVSSAPTGTFISFSTGPGQLAKDGQGRNSPYTKALLENIAEPGLTINKVFMNVRSKVMKETGQVPWELSSLVGDFYFRAGSMAESTPVTSTPVVDYAAERRKVEDEREQLRQKATLEEEKRKLEEAKQQLAMSKRPPAPKVREIARVGRFIAYSNGTVRDTRTNLMWAAKDNGYHIDWANAKTYCKNYRGGGYKDWRMPTQDELAGLYDASKSQQAKCSSSAPNHVATDLIYLTCFWLWTSDARDSDNKLLDFSGVSLFTHDYDVLTTGHRILPVRSGK
jgi:hypothetical protein